MKTIDLKYQIIEFRIKKCEMTVDQQVAQIFFKGQTVKKTIID
jgi:hypothetical protein